MVCFSGNTINQHSLEGSETAFTYLAKALNLIGHDVIVFCVCQEPGFYDGVEYRDIPSFSKWVSQKSCNLFICSRFYQVFEASIKSKIKVLWFHDHILEKDAIEISKKLSSIDLMYYLSKYHAEYTAKFFKKGQGKIKITCNGIDQKLIESVK